MNFSSNQTEIYQSTTSRVTASRAYPREAPSAANNKDISVVLR
ncbi:hypothetical protein PAMC26577_24560 [Caballeronia sordidicola]|uniref:Uncharacterized protein n=1 Tax=Caballeronia sordidicola TaxID=196367 RepID=A0A242MIH7_CABSO|nr:hypothetical protein PAMC26577_24560 [Caballeronia sordidicola]